MVRHDWMEVPLRGAVLIFPCKSITAYFGAVLISEALLSVPLIKWPAIHAKCVGRPPTLSLLLLG